MPTPLTVDTDLSNDGKLVVVASGDIDLSNIGVFSRALNDAASTDGAITVDLSEVEYLYSGAINALFTHADRIDLIIANRYLIPALTVSGLTELATVRRYRSPDEHR
jgi:anti-anti-sigma regulatory factor